MIGLINHMVWKHFSPLKIVAAKLICPVIAVNAEDSSRCMYNLFGRITQAESSACYGPKSIIEFGRLLNSKSWLPSRSMSSTDDMFEENSAW